VRQSAGRIPQKTLLPVPNHGSRLPRVARVQPHSWIRLHNPSAQRLQTACQALEYLVIITADPASAALKSHHANAKMIEEVNGAVSQDEIRAGTEKPDGLSGRLCDRPAGGAVRFRRRFVPQSLSMKFIKDYKAFAT
jgi:hypothetical protein